MVLGEPSRPAPARRSSPMRLLGTPLLVVLALLTVVLPALAVLMWPRVGGPRAARVTGRAAMVVAAQLAAVLLVAAAANDYGYFYGSWHDLWAGVQQAATGSSGGTVTVQGVAARAGDPVAGGVTIVPDRRFSTPANEATRG